MYVRVILPLALHKLFTYSVPAELESSIVLYKRVIVQFGAKKLYSALIHSIQEEMPSYETKEIISVLDEAPIVLEKQIQLWNWISDYYLCSLGEVMNAALPSGLKLESESRITLGKEIENLDLSLLTQNERLILQSLETKRKGLSILELGKLLHRKNVFPMLQSLIAKGLVHVEENLKSSFSLKTETYIQLSEEAKDEDKLQEIFKKIEKRSPKQVEVLMAFIRLCQEEGEAEILKSVLMKKVDASPVVLSQMIKKNIFVAIEQAIDRLPVYKSEPVKEEIQYNEFQTKALQEIASLHKEKDVVLLHGVTSSGKTEIYIRLIQDAIAKGKQVLYLLPEIALTSQIIRRLQKYFGNDVGVYHSKFTDNERVEIWNKQLSLSENASYKIILGARSSVFLPFNNLGLVIVDEEHESSFKQQDPAPRYNARDSAILLAQEAGAKVLLGSATPSLESYYNAISGKFGLVEINQRFGGIQMPEIEVEDLRIARKKKQMKSHFSPMLYKGISDALQNKEQIILFQNRRGFAPYLECPTCCWTPHCIHCDVALVLHKQSGKLRCHYCGFNQEPPSACQACDEPAMKMMGFGTERIEEEMKELFPDAKVARLDLDSAGSRTAFHLLIHEFERKNIDVLVGTQMVTKGLDFDSVSTVGIMNADSMLKYPDFRAHEKSFQLMAQVSGRSGRKNKRGKVIIQAGQADHPIIRFVLENNYKEFFNYEMADRQRFSYPPFTRIVDLTLKHKDAGIVNRAAKYLVEVMKKPFGEMVLGPEIPIVARVRNLYLNKIMIKVPKTHSLGIIKSTLLEMIKEFKGTEAYRSVQVTIDVDPM